MNDLQASQRASRLKIELVVPFLDVAGLEMVVVSLVRTLRNLGHDAGVTCIERPGPLGEKLRDEGYRVTVVPTLGLVTNLLPSALASWFRESKPDVVHVHSGAWLKAARAARLARVPRMIYTLHGIWPEPPWYVPLYSRMAARATDRIVAVSHSLREHLVNDIHIPSGKVRVIENGIDTVRFSPGARSGWLRKRLNIGPDVAIVGTVARLHPVKNHSLLIDAFELVRRQRPESVLVIVGDGPLRRQLEQQVLEKGLERAVFLPGSTTEVADCYRDFDLFVLSSVLEGTSISALEAMACGLCVVATAVGGNPHLLGHGHHGVLVPPANPTALSEAIIDVLSDTPRRDALAEAARRHVAAHHDETSVARAYLREYTGNSSSTA